MRGANDTDLLVLEDLRVPPELSLRREREGRVLAEGVEADDWGKSLENPVEEREGAKTFLGKKAEFGELRERVRGPEC